MDCLSVSNAKPSTTCASAMRCHGHRLISPLAHCWRDLLNRHRWISVGYRTPFNDHDRGGTYFVDHCFRFLCLDRLDHQLYRRRVLAPSRPDGKVRYQGGPAMRTVRGDILATAL